MIVLLTLTALAAPTPEFLDAASSQWTSETSPEQMQQVVDAAVERASQTYPFLVRGLARSKLQQTTAYCADITIEASPDQWVSRCPNGGSFSRSWTGGEQPFTTRKGHLVRTVVAYDPRSVTIEFRGDDGTRTNTYKFEDGRLILDVAITGDRLSVPFGWQFSYTRK